MNEVFAKKVVTCIQAVQEEFHQLDCEGKEALVASEADALRRQLGEALKVLHVVVMPLYRQFPSLCPEDMRLLLHGKTDG